MASIKSLLLLFALLFGLSSQSQGQGRAEEVVAPLATNSSSRVDAVNGWPDIVATTTTLSSSPFVQVESAAANQAAVDEALAVSDQQSRATTVKKELAPTTQAPAQPTTVGVGPEVDSNGVPALTTANGGKAEQISKLPLETLIPNSVGGRTGGELASMSPELSKTLSETLAQLPANAYNRQEVAPASMAADSIESLLPKGTSLFQKDAIDPTQLGQMDCHLRNIDYCVAGMLGTAQKLLPESEPELEARCDEMKATTSCMAIYNKRCSTFRIFSLLAPFSQAPQELRRSQLLTDAQREAVAQAQSAVTLPSELLPSSGKKSSAINNNSKPAKLGDLMELCQPEAKGTPANADLRQRLFALAKCINGRVPKLTPCIDDLKTAVQVFYEPRRVLPMQPTCCALARFRACAMNAVDNICGLSSFEQLVQSMGSDGGGGASGGSAGGGPMSVLKAIDRVCRQATDNRSAYCREVLPPSGMKAPARRGNKASKLAKALDLISFAPATQDFGAM